VIFKPRLARLLILAAVCALASCRAPTTRPADVGLMAEQAAREARLARFDQWTLSGRLAVSGGGEGGSGRLRWRQEGVDYTLELQAPVSRQTWRLSREQGMATLEGLEGGPRRDADPVALLAREVGWQLPLEQLRFWVKGARAPGPASFEFAETGLPIRLNQAGWAIEFREWDRSHAEPLPSKLFAANGERKVRLVIESWVNEGGDIAEPRATSASK